MNLNPIIHNFEWAKNYASQIKAKIMNENEQIKDRS
jgi:hypothetical protein